MKHEVNIMKTRYNRGFDNVRKSKKTSSEEMMTALWSEGWARIKQIIRGKSILTKERTIYKGPLTVILVYVKDWIKFSVPEAEAEEKVKLHNFIIHKACWKL